MNAQIMVRREVVGKLMVRFDGGLLWIAVRRCLMLTSSARKRCSGLVIGSVILSFIVVLVCYAPIRVNSCAPLLPSRPKPCHNVELWTPSCVAVSSETRR